MSSSTKRPRTSVLIPVDSLAADTQCGICLGILTSSALGPCCHRFCVKCYEAANRLSSKVCPSCREPVATKRVLRPDARFDAVLSEIYGDVEAFTAREDSLIKIELPQRRLTPAEAKAKARATAAIVVKEAAAKATASIKEKEQHQPAVAKAPKAKKEQQHQPVVAPLKHLCRISPHSNTSTPEVKKVVWAKPDVRIASFETMVRRELALEGRSVEIFLELRTGVRAKLLPADTVGAIVTRHSDEMMQEGGGRRQQQRADRGSSIALVYKLV